MIRIRAFRAIDEMKACLLFIEGHANVLRDYGVTKVTSSNHDWMRDPNVYVVTVEDGETGEIHGGERIHIKGQDSIFLPIENAVGVVDTRIYSLIAAYKHKGSTAELCGLWNSKKIAGQGISILLTKMGVALANLIAIEKLFVLCAPYTVKMCQNAGFEIETSIGNNGTFYYPKLDLIATSLVIEDMKNLSKADESFRKEILHFIDHPEDKMQLHTTKNEIMEIEYSLSLKKL
jgi:hypothetical protein